MEPKTTFHGACETNYKGQRWMAPPSGLAWIMHVSYGKKCIHRFTGVSVRFLKHDIRYLVLDWMANAKVW
jgi:hypothetical protein